MTAVYRVDYSGKLGKLQRTPQGGYRIPATIARVGVLEYGDGKGGVVREYNPPEVLQAAMDSLADGPVTNEHPADEVTPSNYRNHSSGHVSGTPTFKDGMLHATLAIQDAALIADIEAGTRREVSAGYRAHVDHTPGTTPAGEPYDAIRTRIDFNHVAVVSEGRAGPNVRLVLDSAGRMHIGSANATLMDVAQPTNEEKLAALRLEMTDLQTELAKPASNWQVRRLAELEALVTVLEQKFKVDGAEYEIKSAPAVQAVVDGAIAKRDALVSTAEGARDAAKARADKAEADLKVATDKLTEATSPARIDALVSARLTLIESARKVCGKDFKADGKTELAIVSEVAQKAHPKLDLKDKSEFYVRALFDAAVSAEIADPDGLKLLAGERTDAAAVAAKAKSDAENATKVETKSDARAEMLKHNQSLGKKNNG